MATLLYSRLILLFAYLSAIIITLIWMPVILSSVFIVYESAPTMLSKEHHLWASHAFGEPMGGYIRWQWHIVHWDQRRIITVGFDGDLDSEKTAIGRFIEIQEVL
jgi:hypothetical protein